MARHFDIVEGLEGLKKIRESWEDLTAGDNQSRYFHTHIWHRAYAEALETNPESLVTIIAFKGRELEAIFPFRLWRRSILGLPIRILQFPQHPHLRLHDVVVRHDQKHEHLLRDLLEFLQGHRGCKCDAIYIGKALESSGILRLIREDDSLTTTLFPMGYSDSLPAFSASELPNLVSRNLKGNLRKARSKLCKRDEAKFLTTRDPNLLPEYYEKFLDIEASGWKGANGSATAVKLDPSLTHFYGRLVEYFGSVGDCEINLLEIDGRIAAGQFGLIVGNAMHLLKIGYAEDFAELAPGNLLLANTLDRLSKDSRISEVDLVTDAAWHRSWRPAQQRVYGCCIYTDGPAARLLLACGHGYWAARQGYRSLQQIVTG
jgi:hypothetical protein